MSDLLIENITIVTMNEKREILENHSLLVEGSRSTEIGSAGQIQEKNRDALKVIDGTGKIIFPGFINTHNHLFQTLLKGLGDGLNLADWLAQMTFPSSAHLQPEDIKKAKKYDLKVSHNTTSNMYLASGVAPVPAMLKEGLTIGLGVDGAASNNSQDMIEFLKQTALLHKVYTQNPTIITAEKVLEMATIDGARAIGEEKNIGSIEIGEKADFFIYNPSLSAKSTPMHHPVSTLVYSGTHACVETVVIDGNIILENSVLLTPNESEVIKKGQEAADDLAKRAGTDGNKRRKWRSIIE